MIIQTFWKGSILLTSSPSRQRSSIAAHPPDHHVITIPPVLPHDSSYPSPLHNIFVCPILTAEETAHLLQLARSHAAENHSWDRQDSSRHVSYNTVDFAVEESAVISSYLGEDGIRFQDRIFAALSEKFDVDFEDLSFLDLFCSSYEANDGKGVEGEKRATMDRLDFHRDGSLLSFTVLLSPPTDFNGGGTIFDALREAVPEGNYDSSILQPQGSIQPLHAGHATLHSGKLLHGGHVVTKGQRVVLVGFVDVDYRNIREGVLGEATKEWGRNDVRMFWNRRRLDLLMQQQVQDENDHSDRVHPRWNLGNWRYLPKDTTEPTEENTKGRRYFGPNFEIPDSILDNINGRASAETIRTRRLSSEDKLLREILLPQNQRRERLSEGDRNAAFVDMDEVTIIDS